MGIVSAIFCTSFFCYVVTGMVACFRLLEEQEEGEAGYQSIIIFSSFGSTGTQGPAHIRGTAWKYHCRQSAEEGSFFRKPRWWSKVLSCSVWFSSWGAWSWRGAGGVWLRHAEHGPRLGSCLLRSRLWGLSQTLLDRQKDLVLGSHQPGRTILPSGVRHTSVPRG